VASQEEKHRMKLMPGTAENAPEKELHNAPSAARRWSLGRWQLWIGIIFSLGFLILALYDVDLKETVNALLRVNVLLLGAAVASYVFSVAAKVIRWQVLLAVRKTPTFARAFSVLSIGMIVNTFLPARLGEIARAYLMGEAEEDNKFYILGTIAVEKVADLLFLLLILAVLLLQMALPTWLIGPARGIALFLAILVPCFVILAWQRDFVLRVVERASQFVPLTWREWLVRQTRYGLVSLDGDAPAAPAVWLVNLVIGRLDTQCAHQCPGFSSHGFYDVCLGFPASPGGAAGRHSRPFFTGSHRSFSIPCDSHTLDICCG
jgi:uncharacterized membrane protein YbhN (UPF0104 family)